MSLGLGVQVSSGRLALLCYGGSNILRADEYTRPDRW